MIVLQNQLALQFNIGSISDFLDIEDFTYMRIAENAGGLRPTLNLQFTVSRNDIIQYLNSGNIIYLMYGIDEPTSEILQFEICGDSKNKEYRVGSTVNILAAMYNHDFTSKTRIATFPNKKSYEVLNAIASQNGLKFVSNVSNTIDKQTWYQNGILDWEMADFVAQRAYKNSDTFFAYGFDNNTFFFYDIREKIKSSVNQGVNWILSVNQAGTSKSDKIVNIGSYYCDDSNAGINAELAGKNVTNIGYNLDTGEISRPGYTLKTFTTIDTNKINLNSVGCGSYNYKITTSDEHDFTIQSINQNKRNNIMFSSYTCYVPVAHQYRNFKLLDTVQLIPLEKDHEAEGLYFITGISKEYKNNLYTTILTLNRESANGIQGDYLEGGA